MTKTIFKFELVPGAEWVSMPTGAKLLTFENQREHLCIWAEVNPEAEPERRYIKVYRTGYQMPDEPGTYIGTAAFSGGDLIFHAYDQTGLPR